MCKKCAYFRGKVRLLRLNLMNQEIKVTCIDCNKLGYISDNVKACDGYERREKK